MFPKPMTSDASHSSEASVTTRKRRGCRRILWGLAVLLVITAGLIGAAAFLLLSHQSDVPMLSASSEVHAETLSEAAPSSEAAPIETGLSTPQAPVDTAPEAVESKEPQSPSAQEAVPAPVKEEPPAQASVQAAPSPKPEEAPGPAWQAAPPANPSADAPSVVELQPFRETQHLSNARGDEITLINLNKNVGAWYLLQVKVDTLQNTFHLEVPSPKGGLQQRPRLSLYRDGLSVLLPGEPARNFPLWADPLEAVNPVPRNPAELNAAPVLSEVLKPDHVFEAPFNIFCDGLVLARAQKQGASPAMERVTDLLRTTRFGDWVVEKAKPYLIPSPELGENNAADKDAAAAQEALLPRNARLEATQHPPSCKPATMGVAVDAPEGRLIYGQWYKAVNHPGVYVSVMKPSLIEKALLDTYKDRVDTLGKYDNKEREAEALVYLLAFDTSLFTFDYVLGADHPRVEWSARTGKLKDKGKGPDGFDTVKPLNKIGSIPPYDAPLAAAAFTGGFKREHAAFKLGALSKVNNGSHFGFMEQGVLMSRLNPGLATAWMGLDGNIELLTWGEKDVERLPHTFGARQNGVPLIEGVDDKGVSIPGALVNQWGTGAWSGSKDGSFLTVRSGMATQETGTRHFILYGYFTGSTPNGMARVFQAYGCHYAMQLDMNALSLCYCALYTRDSEGKVNGAEYIHKGMESFNGPKSALRFLHTNDARDFFYVMTKPRPVSGR